VAFVCGMGWERVEGVESKREMREGVWAVCVGRYKKKKKFELQWEENAS